MTILCSALCGCGSGPATAPPAESADAPDHDDARLVVKGGPVTIIVDFWELQAKESSATVAESGSAVIELDEVTGDLFDEGGGIASTFTAMAGVSQGSHLQLTGKVTLTSVDKDVFLTADKVVFNEEAGYVRAEGNVWIESASMRLGPLSILLATPGLERVGTPEIFQS